MVSVKNSFFALNAFGFRHGGVNPFLQARVYKSFCISRILYGIEILNINKKTLKSMNVAQNDIVRYMTGLSRNSHISSTLKILRLFNISELYIFMKLVFIKNLKNNCICNRIFNYQLSNNQQMQNSKSFFTEFKNICTYLNLDYIYVNNNIFNIIKDFKNSTLTVDDSLESEIIKCCLENNHMYIMRYQLNLVTYAGN